MSARWCAENARAARCARVTVKKRSIHTPAGACSARARGISCEFPREGGVSACALREKAPHHDALKNVMARSCVLKQGGGAGMRAQACNCMGVE